MRHLCVLAALTACASPDDADADGDGFTVDNDCDDDAKSIHPKAEDPFGDGVDSNCDGADGIDLDGDGLAGIDSGGVDCDDSDPDYAGADMDSDGFRECVDCNDNDPAVNPSADDPCNAADDNCDGRPDVDTDGVGSCSLELIAQRKVDVLMVIDNSASMFEEQASLAVSAPILIDTFLDEGIDFHIGSVSTDTQTDYGRLTEASGVRWIDRLTPDPHDVASQMIRLGTGGSFDEKGLDAAYRALNSETGPGGYNEGFVREDADLSIIVLSDEDDHSSDVLPVMFHDWLNAYKIAPLTSAFHSVVSPSPRCPSAAEAGLVYLNATTAIGGFTQSICDADYQAIIESIALEHTTTTTQFFVLPYPVDPTTLAARMTTEAGVVEEYSADDLTWEPSTLRAGLPAPAPSGSTLIFWFAPEI